MTSPTQMVVGKGIPNPLTAKDLLKILRDLILFDSPPKSLTNSCPWDGRIAQNNIHFSNKVNHESKPIMLTLNLWSFKLGSFDCFSFLKGITFAPSGIDFDPTLDQPKMIFSRECYTTCLISHRFFLNSLIPSEILEVTNRIQKCSLHMTRSEPFGK